MNFSWLLDKCCLPGFFQRWVLLQTIYCLGVCSCFIFVWWRKDCRSMRLSLCPFEFFPTLSFLLLLCDYLLPFVVQLALSCTQLTTWSTLLPLLSLQKSAEELRAVMREELICSTAAFQQYFTTSTTAAAAGTSSTPAPVASTTSGSAVSLDGNSQGPPDTNSRAASSMASKVSKRSISNLI